MTANFLCTKLKEVSSNFQMISLSVYLILQKELKYPIMKAKVRVMTFHMPKAFSIGLNILQKEGTCWSGYFEEGV